MNRNAAVLVIILLAFAGVSPVSAETSAEDSGMLFGLHLLAGGRYDDVRMCVGSPAGVLGGPIVDIYLDFRFPVGKQAYLAVNVPVMRPILFGIAFNMLQFEPQLTYEYYFPSSGRTSFVLGGGLGVILHYGPDYESDKDTPGESFFAAGPLVSISAGLSIRTSKGGIWMPGLKAFYSPLFAVDHDSGTVAGGALELHYIF